MYNEENWGFPIFYGTKNERRTDMDWLTEALKSGVGIKLSEALSAGGMVTLMGLVIVFAVLVILMLVLMLFKVIFYRPEEAAQNKPVNAPQTQAVKKTSVNESPNDETTAVIAAAIASSQDAPIEKIKIKSIRKI